MRLTEDVVGLLRGALFPGKGRLFGWCTPCSGERQIVLAGTNQMRIDLANGQQRQMFMGCFNIQLQRVLHSVLRQGDTVLDVGANVGFVALLASHLVGKGGRVYAIEPCPPTFDLLSSNLLLSKADNVTALNVALSDHPGSLRLYVPRPEVHRDFNVSIVSGTDTTPIDVPCRTLTDCFADWGTRKVALMKIDVEGAESLVLKGGAESLRVGAVAHLVCEMNAGYLRDLGSSQRDLFEQIVALGFRPARIAGGRAVAAKSAPALLEDGDPDLFFVHTAALND